jgi:hypothetical protein
MSFTQQDFERYKHLNDPSNFSEEFCSKNLPLGLNLMMTGRSPVLDIAIRDDAITMMMWQMTFRNDQTILWMSRQKRRTITDHFRSERNRLDAIWQPKMVHSNTEYIEFDNGSRLIVRAMTEHAGRGMSMSHLVVDGCTPKDLAMVMQNLYPTVSMGGRILFLMDWGG